MKALVVSILVNGMHAGFLEYNDNTWDVCRDLIDAKLFAEDNVYSVEYDAKQYVKYQGVWIYLRDQNSDLDIGVAVRYDFLSNKVLHKNFLRYSLWAAS